MSVVKLFAVDGFPQVELDGKRVDSVRSFVLRASADDIVRAELEVSAEDGYDVVFPSDVAVNIVPIESGIVEVDRTESNGVTRVSLAWEPNAASELVRKEYERRNRSMDAWCRLDLRCHVHVTGVDCASRCLTKSAGAMRAYVCIRIPAVCGQWLYTLSDKARGLFRRKAHA